MMHAFPPYIHTYRIRVSLLAGRDFVQSCWRQKSARRRAQDQNLGQLALLGMVPRGGRGGGVILRFC